MWAVGDEAMNILVNTEAIKLTIIEEALYAVEMVAYCSDTRELVIGKYPFQPVATILRLCALTMQNKVFEVTFRVLPWFIDLDASDEFIVRP